MRRRGPENLLAFRRHQMRIGPPPPPGRVVARALGCGRGADWPQAYRDHARIRNSISGISSLSDSPVNEPTPEASPSLGRWGPLARFCLGTGGRRDRPTFSLGFTRSAGHYFSIWISSLSNDPFTGQIPEATLSSGRGGFADWSGNGGGGVARPAFPSVLPEVLGKIPFLEFPASATAHLLGRSRRPPVIGRSGRFRG